MPNDGKSTVTGSLYGAGCGFAASVFQLAIQYGDSSVDIYSKLALVITITGVGAITGGGIAHIMNKETEATEEADQLNQDGKDIETGSLVMRPG